MVINSDTLRASKEKKASRPKYNIFYQADHEQHQPSRHLVVKVCQQQQHARYRLSNVYTHALSARSSSSPSLYDPVGLSYLIGVGYFERRARARGHRKMYSLLSNTPDTSYNNLVIIKI